MRKHTDGMQMGFTEKRLRTERQQDHKQEIVQRGMGLFEMRRLRYEMRGLGTKDLERRKEKDFN